VSTCCSLFTDVAGRQFDAGKVAQELVSYHKSGPGPTTRLLRDLLVDAGLARGVLLDIGTGFGALTFELLDRGMARAVAVDASSAYLAAAAEEARRRATDKNIELVHGDFVDVAATLPCADIVALDRVVCCYPQMEPLVRAAASRAYGTLALSYPRELWYVRAALAIENLRRRMAGNPFRTFVHSPRAMEQLIQGAGFRLRKRRRTWMWSIDVFVRI
jgi:SAM-dependent methyltransferase